MTALELAFRAIAHRHPLLIAEAYDTLSTEPVLVLSLLNARSSAPPGTGTRFMEQLCRWADGNGVTLCVRPMTLGQSVIQYGYKATSSEERLVQFYSRFGFTRNQRGPGTMRRSPKNERQSMKHTAKSAAVAVRSLLERTSRIAKTWPEFWQERNYRQSLAPHERPGGSEWASAYQAYRLTAEQVHGPGARLSMEQSRAVQEAIQEVMPELFAEHWDALPMAEVVT